MLEIYIDGGCQPNPSGICGYGVIAFRDGLEHWSTSGVVGHGEGMTNNVGEYSALIEVLKWLEGQVPEEVVIYSDSQLIVQQMTFNYGAVFGSYMPYFLESVKRLTGLLPPWKDLIKFVKIERNHRLHWLAHNLVDREIREYAKDKRYIPQSPR